MDGPTIVVVLTSLLADDEAGLREARQRLAGWAVGQSVALQPAAGRDADAMRFAYVEVEDAARVDALLKGLREQPYVDTAYLNPPAAPP